MPTQSPLSSELRDLYASESSKFQQQFCLTKDGLGFLQQRSALVESIALRLWEQVVSPEKGAASRHVLIALGDFGRRSLFPYSEIELLLLHEAEDVM
jgi:UTP:GlnB (protein PII) uridylyltransferase